MEYGTSTGTPSQPDQPQQYAPTDGISTGGVLTLAVLAAIAVASKWSRKPRQQGTQKQAPPATGKLPAVSMEDLRGNAPFRPPAQPPAPFSAPVPAQAPVKETDAHVEKGVSAIGASVAKLQANKLDIPYQLTCRLQPAPWKAMCSARKLSGLERGDLEKTPYGVAVHVKFRGALDFPTVQRSLGQIETGLDTESGAVRLRPGATAGSGILDVRIRDPLAEGVPWEVPAVPVRLAHPVRLAVTPFGDTVELDLKQRVGVFGTSGSGKSCVQRLAGAHVAQAIDADLEIWDLKFGVESQHYAGKAHRVTSVGEATDRLDWLLNVEFPRRAAKLKQRGMSEWVETPWEPARVIIIDEGNIVIRGFKDWRPEKVEGEPAGRANALERFFQVIEQGRALGVYFLYATQFPKSTNLPTEIRSQLNATVCLKLRTSEESSVVFKDDVADGWAPHDLLGPGWLMVKDDRHTVPVDAKAVWLSLEEFRAVPVSGDNPDREPLVSRTPGLSLSKDSEGLSGTADRTDSGQSLTVQDTEPDRTDSGQDTGTDVATDVWLVLSVSETAVGVSELSRRTGRSKGGVHGAIQRMLSDGRVVSEGAGYRLRTADEN